MTTGLLPTAAMLLLLAAPVRAAETDAERDAKIVETARRFSVTEKQVLLLRQEGLGWGEIDNALAISQKSEQPLSEVMSLRHDGMGWGKIAHHYGFSLGEAVREARRRDLRDSLNRGKSPGERPSRGNSQGRDRK